MPSRRLNFVGLFLIILLLVAMLAGCSPLNAIKGSTGDTSDTNTGTKTESSTSTQTDSDVTNQIAGLFTDHIANDKLVYLSLDVTNNAKGWKGKECSDKSTEAAYYEQNLSNGYTWKELPEHKDSVTADYTLTISNDSGANYIQFYHVKSSTQELVYYYQDGLERWFSVTPNTGTNPISELFRSWYDTVEFASLQKEDTVSGSESDFIKIAQTYGKALADTYLKVAPGSVYEATYAQFISANVYSTIPGDQTQFCFTLTLELQPADVTSGKWEAGTYLKPISESTPTGHWQKTAQIKMQKVDNVWTCVKTGTEGITLSN